MSDKDYRKPKHITKTIAPYLRNQSYFFKTCKGIYGANAIAKSTEVFAEYLRLPKKPGNILDLGAGYGVVGIIVAKDLPNPAGYTFYFSEIDRLAVKMLRQNLKFHKIPNYEVIKGDFLEKGRELQKQGIKFTSIYTNPPIFEGKDTILQMFDLAIELLAPNGEIQFVMGNKTGAKAFSKIFRTRYPEYSTYLLKAKAGQRIYRIIKKTGDTSDSFEVKKPEQKGITETSWQEYEDNFAEGEDNEMEFMTEGYEEIADENWETSFDNLFPDLDEQIAEDEKNFVPRKKRRKKRRHKLKEAMEEEHLSKEEKKLRDWFLKAEKKEEK